MELAALPRGPGQAPAGRGQLMLATWQCAAPTPSSAQPSGTNPGSSHCCGTQVLLLRTCCEDHAAVDESPSAIAIALVEEGTQVWKLPCCGHCAYRKREREGDKGREGGREGEGGMPRPHPSRRVQCNAGRRRQAQARGPRSMSVGWAAGPAPLSKLLTFAILNHCFDGAGVVVDAAGRQVKCQPAASNAVGRACYR